jgi:hypothetical protein
MAWTHPDVDAVPPPDSTLTTPPLPVLVVDPACSVTMPPSVELAPPPPPNMRTSPPVAALGPADRVMEPARAAAAVAAPGEAMAGKG